MAKVNIKELQDVAARFKNYDPPLYDKFLRLLDAWTFEVTVAVTEASAAEILQAQGRAQQARKLMQIFSEATELPSATP